jgi:hypothetical protein
VNLPRLVAVKPKPQGRLDADLRSGRRESSPGRLHRSLVRAFPQDLLRDLVLGSDRAADRAADIGQGDLPPLTQCRVGVGAFDAPSRSRLGLDGVRREDPAKALPVRPIEGVDQIC